MKEYTYNKFAKILKANGFLLDRITGSHATWERNGERVVITTKAVNPMICRRLIKEHGLEV